MTKVLVRFMRHLAHSSSLYPIGTFWLIACAVVPADFAQWITHTTAVLILTVTAGVLVLAAARRDDRRDAAALRADVGHVAGVVDAQRDQLEARIRVLESAMLAAGVPIPGQKAP